MSENTDALERGYNAFNSGDADTLAELYEDDARWEGPNAEGVPMSGTYEGKGAILEALGGIGNDYEEFRAVPDEMIEQGDTVVVLSHLEGKTKAGNDFKVPGVEVYRLSGGKVKRVQTLADTAEMRDALGR